MSGRRSIVGRCRAALLSGVARLRASKLRERIPRPLRSAGYRLLPGYEIERRTWQADYERIVGSAARNPLRTEAKLGIFTDFMLKYASYEAACLELGVPYELVDIAAPDWAGQVEASGCAGFLAWPSHVHSVSKDMFDERLRALEEDMGRVVFPSVKSLWLYESKRRTHDWLRAHGVPHPDTWVFFEHDAAADFIAGADYPMVFKTDLGSTAAGVEIVRSRQHAGRLLRQCFGRGYLVRRGDERDRSWGYMLLQRYIPDASEWRMIRLGDSFFGHQKLKAGEFHSGSHRVGWYRPPDALLDFAKGVTDIEPFLSMDLDVFETADGNYLVNEMQAVFGSRDPAQMYVDGKPGRFVYDGERGSWRFEGGNYCVNGSCTMRVLTLLKLLGKPLDWRPT
jgi:hypothetical protein